MRLRVIAVGHAHASDWVDEAAWSDYARRLRGA